jgi:hypothetical protein
VQIGELAGGESGGNRRRVVMSQCHLACFGQVCCLGFCQVDERGGGRGFVADAAVAGSFHAGGVVPPAFDDAGVSALAPLVAGARDVGHDLFQGAAWLVRGKTGSATRRRTARIVRFGFTRSGSIPAAVTAVQARALMA